MNAYLRRLVLRWLHLDGVRDMIVAHCLQSELSRIFPPLHPRKPRWVETTPLQPWEQARLRRRSGRAEH